MSKPMTNVYDGRKDPAAPSLDFAIFKVIDAVGENNMLSAAMSFLEGELDRLGVSTAVLSEAIDIAQDRLIALGASKVAGVPFAEAYARVREISALSRDFDTASQQEADRIVDSLVGGPGVSPRNEGQQANPLAKEQALELKDASEVDAIRAGRAE